MLPKFAAAVSAILLAASPAQAQQADAGGADGVPTIAAPIWVTLGTRAGPVPSPDRSQPSNLLEHGGQFYLVDVGDGVSRQLALRSVESKQIRAVFISHLHFDHSGGLAALLGLRWQTNAPQPLLVYGPPGTRQLVDGIVASMEPGTTAGYGVPGVERIAPGDTVTVTELRDGNSVELDGMTVTVRSNTHYSFPHGSDMANRFESHSLRFDMPGRSIVYSGDTGPSEALIELARGADLLVTEMMDVDYTINLVRGTLRGVPPQVVAGMERHLRDHHLLPADVAQLANEAGVGAVVVTHFMGREPTDPGHFEYLRTITQGYQGPVIIADDMDAF